MVRFSNEEMADMHMVYGTANGNARRAVRIYQERFPNRHLPDHRMFTALHRRLRENGSFTTNRRGLGRPGRLREDMEEDVLQHFRENPGTSTRAAARDLGIANHVDVWRVLHDNHLHPYRFQRVQELLPTDYPPREQFARWCLRKGNEDENFLK